MTSHQSDDRETFRAVRDAHRIESSEPEWRTRRIELHEGGYAGYAAWSNYESDVNSMGAVSSFTCRCGFETTDREEAMAHVEKQYQEALDDDTDTDTDTTEARS